MILFIAAVLIAAGFQSFCRLALLPRRWGFLVAALLIPLPFVFEDSIAHISLVALERALFSVEALENWCALVIIQELFTLTVGFTLLDEIESGGESRIGRNLQFLRRIPFFERLGKIVRPWKYTVFLPSALLPAGVFYLQTQLFNTFPNYEFRTITIWLAVGLPIIGIVSMELIRLFRRGREARILMVLHVEWVLILCAVFLPVAVNAQLIPGGDETGWESLLALGCLVVPVILSAIVYYLYVKCFKFKRKKVQ